MCERLRSGGRRKPRRKACLAVTIRIGGEDICSSPTRAVAWSSAQTKKATVRVSLGTTPCHFGFFKLKNMAKKSQKNGSSPICFEKHRHCRIVPHSSSLSALVLIKTPSNQNNFTEPRAKPAADRLIIIAHENAPLRGPLLLW